MPTTNREIKITAGPDPEGGYSWCWWDPETGEGNNGGSSHGPRATGFLGERSPTDWLRWLRRHLAGSGIRWAEACAQPSGWSQGSGHAPYGVRVSAPRASKVRR